MKVRVTLITNDIDFKIKSLLKEDLYKIKALIKLKK